MSRTDFASGRRPANGPMRPLWQFDVALGVVLAALTAAAWLVVVQPAVARSRGDELARGSLPEARRSVASAGRALATVQNALNRTGQDLALLDHACWTDLDRSSRVERIYTTSNNAGLHIEAVEPGEVEIVSDRRAYSFRVAARGTYASLAATLAGLRRAMPDVLVRSVDVTAAPVDDRPEVVVTMELLWVPVADGEPTGQAKGAAVATIAREVR